MSKPFIDDVECENGSLRISYWFNQGKGGLNDHGSICLPADDVKKPDDLLDWIGQPIEISTIDATRMIMVGDALVYSHAFTPT